MITKLILLNEMAAVISNEVRFYSKVMYCFTGDGECNCCIVYFAHFCCNKIFRLHGSAFIIVNMQQQQ